MGTKDLVFSIEDVRLCIQMEQDENWSVQPISDREVLRNATAEQCLRSLLRRFELEYELAPPPPLLLESRIVSLEQETRRLSGWLEAIAGGDRPVDDAASLRQMAYAAVTLGRPAPE